MIAYKSFILLLFLNLGLSHRHWHFTGEQGKQGDHIYSSLAFQLVHKLSDIYLQFCIWDDYLLFSIPVHVISRLLLDNNISTSEHLFLIEHYLCFICWSYVKSYYSSFPQTSEWWIWTCINYHSITTNEIANLLS